jgi:hypothetical protein
MGSVDEIAQRYLLLGLRLEHHVPGFVDSYIGPPELREAVAAETPAPVEELRDEAGVLGELVDGLPDETAALRRRREWLHAQLRAIRALARRASGEEIGYVDLVEQLFDVRVAPMPEERFAAARDRLDAALPGQGSLAERYRSWSRSLEVPSERLLTVLQASAERFHRAACRDFDVPPDQAIEWEATRDQAWNAEATFLGGGRTRIRVNLDLPRDVVTVARVAAHEAYPGHHLDNITKERTLVREAGLGEATLRTLSTPELLVAEGLASVGREVVMSDLELGDELRRIARDAGLDTGLAALGAPVATAALELNGAFANAALLLHAEGVPPADVRDYLVETTVQGPEMIDHAMRALADPIGRTYEFAYSEGARLVRAWLEVQGQTTGFARLLAEQHTPSGLAAEAS